MSLNPLKPHKKNIWLYRQNKPSLIAEDINRIYGVPIKDTLKILLSRGVFKWLSVRRDLIKQKDIWKEKIKELHRDQREIKLKLKSDPDSLSLQYRYGYVKGYRIALEQCRKEIRAMCHSDRWRVPDFDQKSLRIVEDSLSDSPIGD